MTEFSGRNAPGNESKRGMHGSRDEDAHGHDAWTRSCPEPDPVPTARSDPPSTQAFRHPRSSTAQRLSAQAEGRHYSKFSLYAPDELRASIAAFLARLPSPEGSWIDKHLLIVVGGSRRNQAEPDSSSSMTSQVI